jgi:hypothetical protein
VCGNTAPKDKATLEHCTERQSHGREPTSSDTADRVLGLEIDPARKNQKGALEHTGREIQGKNNTSPHDFA